MPALLSIVTTDEIIDHIAGRGDEAEKREVEAALAGDARARLAADRGQAMLEHLDRLFDRSGEDRGQAEITRKR